MILDVCDSVLVAMSGISAHAFSHSIEVPGSEIALCIRVQDSLRYREISLGDEMVGGGGGRAMLCPDRDCSSPKRW